MLSMLATLTAPPSLALPELPELPVLLALVDGVGVAALAAPPVLAVVGVGLLVAAVVPPVSQPDTSAATIINAAIAIKRNLEIITFASPFIGM
jgi:hypothetical protein